MSAAVIAYGAVSALGRGAEAASAGAVGEPARVAIARDEELVAAAFAKPFVARAHVEGEGPEDRATRLLAASMTDCLRALDAKMPGWRSQRVGLAIGTSSGGMRTAERFFARIARGEAGAIEADFASRAAYFGPLLDVVREADIAFAPATLVLCACASSVIALGLATRWLAAGECDVALAGGFDAVSPFVASGFESLQATSVRVPPRPFRVGRDGMSLGEASAVVALVRSEAAAGRALAYVRGFGASADAVHITAPDRTGDGLARAARAALAEAGEPRLDLLSAHATATPFNDAAEARGVALALGEDGARSVPIHAFKAQVGHTLGAAGAIESLACIDALTRGVIPATAGEGDLDPDAPARLLERTEQGDPRVALKLASAFGGANAALVLSRDAGPTPGRSVREVWVTRASVVTDRLDAAALAERVDIPVDKLARADALVLWALTALDALAQRIGRGAFEGAGVVVGTAAATLETNARYASRLRDRGPRFVEPRRFPYTSPNAVAGECGVGFRLRGPAFSVGAGLHAGVEALVAACELVRSGDAERMLVVAADDVEDVAGAWARAVGSELRAGAAALLVSSSRTSAAIARVEAATTSLGPAAPAPSGPSGHLALAPLGGLSAPARVEASSSLLGTLGRARVELLPI